MATKLLLADDSITIHKVVGLTFAAEDVQIEAVTNGNLAIEKARANKPDIILADVFMPGRNGYEVCDAIKSDPELSGIPVVLLVGTFEPFDEVEASRVRCDAHLTKPFDTSELIQIIHDLVKKKEAPKPEEIEPTASMPAARAQAAAGAVAGLDAKVVGLISPRTRESFLGENRILDLFDFPALDSKPEAGAQSEAAKAVEQAVSGQEAPVQRPVIPFPGANRNSETGASPVVLDEETIELIVEKVVKRLSENVVRDIAWEVVPALSEIMIRQYLDELRSSPKN
jgi:CheY-like chemotaxis protein